MDVEDNKGFVFTLHVTIRVAIVCLQSTFARIAAVFFYFYLYKIRQVLAFLEIDLLFVVF